MPRDKSSSGATEESEITLEDINTIIIELIETMNARMAVFEDNIQGIMAGEAVMKGIHEESNKIMLSDILAILQENFTKGGTRPKVTPTTTTQRKKPKATINNWFATMYEKDPTFRTKYAEWFDQVTEEEEASVLKKAKKDSENYHRRIGTLIWAKIKVDKAAEKDVKEYRKEIDNEEPNIELQMDTDAATDAGAETATEAGTDAGDDAATESEPETPPKKSKKKVVSTKKTRRKTTK